MNKVGLSPTLSNPSIFWKSGNSSVTWACSQTLPSKLRHFYSQALFDFRKFTSNDSEQPWAIGYQPLSLKNHICIEEARMEWKQTEGFIQELISAKPSSDNSKSFKVRSSRTFVENKRMKDWKWKQNFIRLAFLMDSRVTFRVKWKHNKEFPSNAFWLPAPKIY